jgi:pimeloyl-ACP methyl ester carboxylesterase
VGYIHEQGLEVLPEVLAAAGIERPILLGHSEGGSMAMIFAAKYPGRPRGVVSEAGHAFVEDVNLAHIRRVEHAFTEDDLGEKLRKHHGDQTEAMFRAWSETWLNPEFHGWDIGELLPRISCPVLAVLGADDPYETPAQLRVLRAGIAAPLETVLLPQCGHTPHHEARDRFLPLVARFINVLEPD